MNHAITYKEAIDVYYGGLHEIAKQPIPFTCKNCGGKNFELKQKDDFGRPTTITKPVMTVDDCYRHIRKNHREVIKKGAIC